MSARSGFSPTSWYRGGWLGPQGSIPRSSRSDALLRLDCASPEHRPICDAAHLRVIPALTVTTIPYGNSRQGRHDSTARMPDDISNQLPGPPSTTASSRPGILAVVVSRMASQALIEVKRREYQRPLCFARIAEPLLAWTTSVRRTWWMKPGVIKISVRSLGVDKAARHTTGGFPYLAGANQVGIRNPIIELLTTGKGSSTISRPGHYRQQSARHGAPRPPPNQGFDRLLCHQVLAVGLSIVVAAFVGTMLARGDKKNQPASVPRKRSSRATRYSDCRSTTQCWEFMGCRERTCSAYMD